MEQFILQPRTDIIIKYCVVSWIIYSLSIDISVFDKRTLFVAAMCC